MTREQRPNQATRYLIEGPFSEVCIHLGVAGQQIYGELVSQPFPLVQLYRLDNSPFSFPILPGEAGFYQDGEGGFYFYPPANPISLLVVPA